MSTTETTADKLEKVLNTKQAIREAILAKGGTLETDVFDTYPDAILNLPGTKPPIQRSYYFGYDLDTTDQNPATCVSYPSDVDNAEYAKAVMNFGVGFNYGGWPSIAGDRFMPKPCMLKYDGTVDYYLDQDDYGVKETGEASDVANINYAGNAMMEWPKIYTKRWQEGDIYHFRCSDAKLDSEYECWCNYDKDDNEIDHFYTAIYTGVADSGGWLRSISNKDNLTELVFTTFRARSRNRDGDNWKWDIEVLSDYKLIQDLLVMMFKSTDLQATAGYGRVIGNTSPIKTGTMDTKGLFWGSDDKISGVKVFGMENYWGNLRRWIAGWIAIGRTQYVKLTHGLKDGSSTTNYNDDATGYINLQDSDFITNGGYTAGYINGATTFSHGRYPFSLLGTGTTFIPDMIFSVAQNATDAYIAQISGHWTAGYNAGPFYVNISFTGANYGNYLGASISCKPLAPTS